MLLGKLVIQEEVVDDLMGTFNKVLSFFVS